MSTPTTATITNKRCFIVPPLGRRGMLERAAARQRQIRTGEENMPKSGTGRFTPQERPGLSSR